MTPDYDLIVMGAGSAGLVSAKAVAKTGRRVLLVDEDTIGGTCVSYGCVPKKIWHGISHARHAFDLARDHGWSFETPSFSWDTVQPRLMAYIAGLNDRHEAMCESAGVTIVRGRAQFVSATTVAIEGTHYTAAHIVIAVGARAVRLPVPGSSLCDTSYEFFSWTTQPSSVVVWGGGYIAVEMASILNALGTTVHLIIRQDRVLRGFDDAFRTVLHERYEQDGIHIHPNTTIEQITPAGDKKCVTLRDGTVLTVDRVLQAVGRVPNTDDLGCEVAGVMRTSNGAIQVDEAYQTTAPTVSALGDCIDRIQLTPVAIAQAREWVHNRYLKAPFPVDYSIVPTAIFSHPEAACVGMTETQARAEHPHIDVKSLSFTPLSHALATHKVRVWMTVIWETDHGRVLGIHMIGDGSAEIIQALAVAVQRGITKDDLDRTMALHPSVTEELVTIY